MMSWIDILIYIDDTFLRAPTSQQLLCNLKYTQMLFKKCDLTINLEKSCLSPTTCMEFLGFVLDSIDSTISITAHKRQSLRHLIEPIVAHPLQKIHIKKLAKIIGIIVSFFPASDEARLHYRILERYETHAKFLNTNPGNSTSGSTGNASPKLTGGMNAWKGI